MVKNIVFDVGKVLVYFEPDWLLDYLGYDEETSKVLKKELFFDPIWEEADRGVLSKEELVQACVDKVPAYEKEVRAIYKNIGQTLEIMPHTMEWLANLKERGYRLYLISNYGEELYEQTEDKLQFLPYMDGTLFSYQYKMIKPDLEIYRKLLEEYDLEASECAFIDDRQENIDAAEKVGYRGIRFLNYEQAKADLDCLLNENK